ncbi:unnamed protein product [Bursaphelenchus xylophilus]|uniref:(pine wood nematode) hypothetical protein n=1 Tax=Bursaphelenchus xylophilus TaxID=6326 RepID=A0A1I7RPH2_BURXY|nr:unnamed protein product [Bursaphelenchus xylophilus]CAG9096016.1 unnamed protein product [Bursaphelenchus xylophilus]
MFYSLNILKRKNAQFYLIWKLAHNGNVSKKEVENVDIEKYCQDLRSYIPTGSSKDVRNEVKTKMSLYLLSILYYGIVVTHHKKVEAFLSKLEHFLDSLKPQIVVQIKKRPPLLEEQEETRPKKRRRHLQMLEFEGDPLSILTHDEYRELNRQITLPDDIHDRPLDAEEFMQELIRDMYQDPQQNLDSLLPEVPPFVQEEIIQEHEMQFPQERERSYDGEVKYNSLMDFEMPTYQEARDWNNFLDTVNQPSLFELDAGPLRTENSVDISIDGNYEFLESSNRIVLPQIETAPRNTTGRRNPPARRPRRHARIIYDEKTSLDDDEIANGLQDFFDCIEPLKRPSKAVKSGVPRLFQMTSNLPEYVLDKYEEVLDRAELGELRQLLNDISRLSTPVNGRLSPKEERNIPEEPIPEVQHEMGMQFPAEEQVHPYENVENVPPQDELQIQMENLDEIEERRRSSIGPSFYHRSSELEQPQLDVIDESRLNDENIPPGHPAIVQGEKTLTRQQTIFESPTQERAREERNIHLNSPSETRFDLHRRIYEKAHSQPVVHLDEVFTDPQSTREKARDFSNLLWLLKEQKLESEQDEPYGRIKLMSVKEPEAV